MIRKINNFFKKVLSGKNPTVVYQSLEEWNTQYKKGTWNFLTGDAQNIDYISEKILSLCGNRPVSILDVGCGNGALLTRLEKIKERIVYTGVDISKEAITQLGAKFPFATLVEDDIEHYSLSEHFFSFDVIVFSEVLYYVDYKKVLINFKRKTPKTSMVLISVYNSWRSFFIWRTIHKMLTVNEVGNIKSPKGVSWKVVLGNFK